MNVRRTALALATLLTAAAPAAALANPFTRGAIELTPTVSFSHSSLTREGYGNVDTFTELDVTPAVGYCLNDRFEVTGGFKVRHSSTNGMGDTALGTTAGMIYNFTPRGTIIPFAGLGFGVLFSDGFTFDDTAVLAPVLTGGIRLPVGESAAVNLSMGYQRESNDHVHVNRLVGAVGVSLFPWRSH